MSEFKGTKGKWFFSKGTLSIWHPNEVGYRLALVDEVIKDGYVLTEETQANALLISKAPEMLEALQEFCDRVEKGEVRSTKTYNKFKELIKQATEG